MGYCASSRGLWGWKLMQPLWNSLQVPETRCGGAFWSGQHSWFRRMGCTPWAQQHCVQQPGCGDSGEMSTDGGVDEEGVWCVATRTRARTYMCVYTRVCTHVYVCARVCVCTYTCVHSICATHTQSCLSHERKETMLLAAPCEDLEVITPSEVRDRSMTPFIYGIWNAQVTLSINRQTHRQRGQTLVARGPRGWGMGWKFGMSRCPLLHRERTEVRPCRGYARGGREEEDRGEPAGPCGRQPPTTLLLSLVFHSTSRSQWPETLGDWCLTVFL